MTAFSVQTPYPPFADADGAPLENGYIWLGSAGLDPQSNPVTAYFDSALTIAAAQPIRTQGGYPVYQGTPARIYINGTNYSIRVMNKNGLTVYTALNNVQPLTGSTLDVTGITTLAALTASGNVTVAGTTTLAALTASGNISFDGGSFVFNESGADKDARFEGDTDPNLLFLDASTDRVGIGTATPTAKLTVGGTATVTGDVLFDGGTFVFNESGADKDARFEGDTDANLLFLDASTDRVGVGTATPTEKLDVDGSVIVRGFLTPTDAIKFGANTSAPSTTDAFIYRPADNTLAFGTASAEHMRLDASGNLYCQGVYANTTGSAANVFVASNGLLQRSTSSLKYKTDVQDAVHGLAEVMRLRPVTYKGKNDGDKVFGGLIAEEVHAVGLTEFVAYNDASEPDALHYGNMVALLTKAVQEQQSLINDLTARVAALEAK